MEALLKDFSERIRAAASAGEGLRIRGSGSKDWYGEPGAATAGAAQLLDTRACTGVVAYEPTELVLTAWCGTPLAQLDAMLAGQGQMLAFEPPHFGPGATLGGMVAAGLSGPRRQSAGALRDYVLGVDLIDGRGAALRFGGQVMKNVAGYDVARLMAGSLGTLGLITRASLKVLPRPAAECSLRFACSQQEALELLRGRAFFALPLSASAWHDGALTVRLSGAAAAVGAARRALGGGELPDADAYWRAVREQSLDWFRPRAAPRADEAQLWRVSLPAASPALPLPPDVRQLLELGGAQRWAWLPAPARTDSAAGAGTGEPGHACDGAALRAMAARLGGHATLFRGRAPGLPVFQPLPAPLRALHRRLKRGFDPAGIFNRGRMAADI